MKTEINVPFTSRLLHTVSTPCPGVSNLLLHFPESLSLFEIIRRPQDLPTLLQLLVLALPARQSFPEYTSTSSNTSRHPHPTAKCLLSPSSPASDRNQRSPPSPPPLPLPSHPANLTSFPTLEKRQLRSYHAGHSDPLTWKVTLPLLHLLGNQSFPVLPSPLRRNILVSQLISF